MNARPSLRFLMNEGRLWFAECGHSPQSWERTAPALPRAPFGIPEIDSVLPERGLRFGALHEWFPSRDSEAPRLILSSLAGKGLQQLMATSREPERVPSRLIVWIGKGVWPTPHTIEHAMTVEEDSQRTSLLTQCLFVDPPHAKSALWTLETALSSPAVAVVIAETPRLSLSTTRRLSLAAQRGGTLGLLVRSSKEIDIPTASSSQWRITPTPSLSSSPCWKLDLLRCKGTVPLTSTWIVEWSNDPAISLRIPPPLVGESCEKAITAQKRKRG